MDLTFKKEKPENNVIEFKKKGDESMVKKSKKKLFGVIGGGLALGGALLAVLDHMMKNVKTEEVDSIPDEPDDDASEFPGVGGEDE